jgi:hypothetical protein
MIVEGLQQRSHQQQCKQMRGGEVQLGSDEENIIRYMAGYIPFKLMKAYLKKTSIFKFLCCT